ncbi:MAG: ornithine carbamoyltransferase, partial [Clostridia bacterium]|nr:ornithine carbamoyltransferase [Clostridia bacterium]
VWVASPPDYAPRPEIVAAAEELAAATGARITVTSDPAVAAADADVLYTDVWASMGQEEEQEIRRRVLAPYRLDSSIVALAKPDVLVMHCLPAHRGEEISDAVIDGPHAVVFDQAENRLHTQKALLLLLLYEGRSDPA